MPRKPLKTKQTNRQKLNTAEDRRMMQEGKKTDSIIRSLVRHCCSVPSDEDEYTTLQVFGLAVDSGRPMN